MKRYLLTLLIAGLVIVIYNNISQSRVGPVATNRTKPKLSFTPEEILKAEKAAKEKNKKPKTNKPDEFIKYHQMIRTRDGREGPEYAANYKLTELKTARAKRQQVQLRTQALDWVERGPGNVPGRTRGLLVMPGDPDKNTWLAGSVGGGVWKTEDGGRSWSNKTPNFPSLATVSLAHSPLQPDIIYAGTGEAFSASTGFIPGDGIFKSLDGGETWSQLASTDGNPNFANVNRLIVDPDNPDLVLACTNSSGNTADQRFGIFRSTNGGSTWSKVYDGVDQVQQLVATPGDFNILYGSVRANGVVKSTDAGLTWQDASNGLEPTGRLEMAIAPTKPDRLYATVEGTVSGNFSDLYLSDDAGANWNIVLEENN
ncbi:MAG: VPS10 domain-containing protein, partial [Cyclobacteriaceae bacterium]